MNTITKRSLEFSVAMLTASVLVLAASTVEADEGATDHVDAIIYDTIESLGMAEPTVVYGRLTVVDIDERRFSIAGLADLLIAQRDVDLSTLDGSDVEVHLRAAGSVRSIEVLDPTKSRAPTRGVIDTMKSWVGLPTTTVIDGVLSVGSEQLRTFAIEGLDTRYVAPEGIDLKAVNDAKVRVEVDEDGRVAAIALLPEQA
jgi:hypothetical protein